MKLSEYITGANDLSLSSVSVGAQLRMKACQVKCIVRKMYDRLNKKDVDREFIRSFTVYSLLMNNLRTGQKIYTKKVDTVKDGASKQKGTKPLMLGFQNQRGSYL